MEIFLLALSPLVVNILTQGIKKIRTISLSDNRKIIVRFIAALFSFLAICLISWADNTAVDESVITPFAETILVFIVSQYTYFLSKKLK